jgi:outer membrane protein assembly factor BamB
VSRAIVAGLLSLLVATPPSSAGDWPQFRGPTGQGTTTADDVPLSWGPEENVVWRTELAGDGWSSPVLVGDRLYLTTAVPPAGGDGKARSLRALCFDAANGAELWNVEVFSQTDGSAGRVHAKNSHASPTPIVDGEHLFVHFGTHGTACLDFGGAILWRYTDAKFNQVHGTGGAPVLAAGRLVFNCDGGDRQFVVALDRATGEEAWRRERPAIDNKPFSFSTPLVVTIDGREQVVSPCSDQAIAYDPRTGDEIWLAEFTGYSVIPRPVYAHGLLFLSTSYDRPTFLAVQPVANRGPNGDPVKVPIRWSADRGAPHTPSAVVVGDEVFTISDNGIATCYDAPTGEVHWQERIGGNFSASPIAVVEGDQPRVYFQDEAGLATVVAASTSFERLGTNDLGERTLASWAVDDGTIYIRTAKALYRIGESRRPTSPR